jgi:hypothetical protein
MTTLMSSAFPAWSAAWLNLPDTLLASTGGTRASHIDPRRPAMRAKPLRRAQWTFGMAEARHRVELGEEIDPDIVAHEEGR